MLNEFKGRGVRDCLIAVTGGLEGFLQAVASAFPWTRVRNCIVHPMRHRLRLPSCKGRPAMARDMKAVCRAASEEAAADRLDGREESRGQR